LVGVLAGTPTKRTQMPAAISPVPPSMQRCMMRQMGIPPIMPSSIEPLPERIGCMAAPPARSRVPTRSATASVRVSVITGMRLCGSGANARLGAWRRS
jgi:hypothetical protein